MARIQDWDTNGVLQHWRIFSVRQGVEVIWWLSGSSSDH
jgi:hypothetical protein